MGCARLLSCGEPDTLCLGMVTVALHSSVFPQKEVDLVCLGGLCRRLPRTGGEPLMSGLQQGLPCSFIGSSVLEQQFGRNGDILTSIFYLQLLNLLKCWGMPLEDAMLKGADVRIITNRKRLNILPS